MSPLPLYDEIDSLIYDIRQFLTDNSFRDSDEGPFSQLVGMLLTIHSKFRSDPALSGLLGELDYSEMLDVAVKLSNEKFAEFVNDILMFRYIPAFGRACLDVTIKYRFHLLEGVVTEHYQLPVTRAGIEDVKDHSVASLYSSLNDDLCSSTPVAPRLGINEEDI